MSTLVDTAQATAARHSMFEPGSPVLVMVSGGGDSVALLHLLAAGEFGPMPLRVLHVNHLLRGDDSAGDERFVTELCSELGVECRVVRYDVGAFAAAEKLNLEDAGRQVRYRFAAEELDAWCEQVGVIADRGRIAVAHTRDDRVETFFMRAIAGSGAGGLNALAPVRERIVRPLSDVDRDEVRSWLTAASHAWREDASNADTTRTRALVRAELVPVAEKLNPSVRSAIVRTMDLLADDDALLSRMADAFARDFARVTVGEHVEFDRDYMRTLERTMARRTVRSAISSAFPEASRLDAVHVEALVEGLTIDDFVRDLPYGLRAVSEYGIMIILRTDAQVQRVAPTLLSLPGNADLGPIGTMTAQPTTPDDTTGDLRSVVIDAGKVGGELTIDSVREGDRMQPLGMSGSRKLSDVISEAKVPRRLREAIPVVRDGDQVVWVAGVRQSDSYKVTANTTDAVRLVWAPIEADDAP